jgi:transcriptional regulator with XRE-family HTH domain
MFVVYSLQIEGELNMANKLGQYLRELRGKRSLREIAELTGLSHTYIADVEKGFRRGTNKPLKPSPESLKKLSEALGAPYVELMVLAGYWDEEELLEPINTSQVNETPSQYASEKEFIASIDLSDEELTKQYKVMVDGRELTEKELKKLLAFVRMERELD